MKRSNFSNEIKKTVYEKTAGHCHVCGCELNAQWEVDHVIPILAGGSNQMNNLLPICSHCNHLRWSNKPEVIRQIFEWGFFVKENIELRNEFGNELRNRLAQRDETKKRKKIFQKDYKASDVDKIKKEYRLLPKEQEIKMSEFLNWVQNEILFQRSSTKSSSYSIGRNSTSRIMTVYADGRIRLIFHEKHYLQGRDQRNALVIRLKSLGLLPDQLNPDDKKEKMTLTKSLLEMDEDVLVKFRECIIEAIRET